MIRTTPWPSVPGGVIHDIPNQMHYDETGPEGATLEFIAMGPAARNWARLTENSVALFRSDTDHAYAVLNRDGGAELFRKCLKSLKHPERHLR